METPTLSVVAAAQTSRAELPQFPSRVLILSTSTSHASVASAPIATYSLPPVVD